MDLTDLHEAAQTLAGIEAPWCICGGWAIDLYLDRPTRPHKDVDISIRRADQLAFQSHLLQQGWQLEIAEKGLFPWNAGEYLELPAHTIWCRQGERFLELLFDEYDDQLFRCRKKPSISLPAEGASLMTKSGFRVLAPEIVLLYKSMGLDNTDNQSDFDNAYTCLPADSQQWLREAVQDFHGAHPWLATGRTSARHT